MKTKYSILIVAILIIVGGSIYLFTQQKPGRRGLPPLRTANTKSDDCTIDRPDPEGYLLKICEYLKKHEGTVFPNKEPDNYSIRKIEDNENSKFIVVRLDCCGTGDLATIDKETKEVIGFSPGDW